MEDLVAVGVPVGDNVGELVGSAVNDAIRSLAESGVGELVGKGVAVGGNRVAVGVGGWGVGVRVSVGTGIVVAGWGVWDALPTFPVEVQPVMNVSGIRIARNFKIHCCFVIDHFPKINVFCLAELVPELQAVMVECIAYPRRAKTIRSQSDIILAPHALILERVDLP